MPAAVFQLVLLVSCAHALVHVYELSFPSLEMQVAADLVDGEQAGRQQMGVIANAWRLPFGFGALIAGWLVDRWGARRMLVVFLCGCSCACAASWIPMSLGALTVVMFTMGAFASIYHPAGLTLISCETEPAYRARALGTHGILGSAGIASAPFLVAMLGQSGADWRQCYLVLALPGLALASAFIWLWGRRQSRDSQAPVVNQKDEAHWAAFALLTALTVLQGLIYSGFICFLTRYLAGSDWGQSLAIESAGMISALVLAAGCAGQFSAGRFARLQRLERQLCAVTAANAPLLLLLAYADGNYRVVAAATFSVVHFMHQPLYNSLVAIYTPVSKRSVCYGFSFAMSFGLGSFGAAIVGFSPNDRIAYQSLAVIAVFATVVAALLWRREASLAMSR